MMQMHADAHEMPNHADMSMASAEADMPCHHDGQSAHPQDAIDAVGAEGLAVEVPGDQIGRAHV